jgi:hypothetical protein
LLPGAAEASPAGRKKKAASRGVESLDEMPIAPILQPIPVAFNQFPVDGLSGLDMLSNAMFDSSYAIPPAPGQQGSKP